MTDMQPLKTERADISPNWTVTIDGNVPILSYRLRGSSHLHMACHVNHRIYSPQAFVCHLVIDSCHAAVSIEGVERNRRGSSKTHVSRCIIAFLFLDCRECKCTAAKLRQHSMCLLSLELLYGRAVIQEWRELVLRQVWNRASHRNQSLISAGSSGFNAR